MSSQLLLIVVVAAICCSAAAQMCSGFNVTLNVGDASYQTCPYGYFMDAAEGRCLTYRQIVNNFLYAPCNINNDCGPLATDPRGGSTMVCGTQKVCTWSATRAFGDACTVNANCASYGLPTARNYYCSKTNNTCAFQTFVYTAKVNQRCKYQDMNEYVDCEPSLICSDATYGTCVARKQIGETCTFGKLSETCVTNAFCNTTTCAAQRTRGQSCGGIEICSQAEGTTICFNNVCSPLRNRDETCSNDGQCNTASDSTLRCMSGFCLPLRTVGQVCNVTHTCLPDLNCVVSSDPLTPTLTICMVGAGNNQTCGTPPTLNRCANNFTCVRGYCSANNAGDQCTYTETTKVADYGNCNPGLICLKNEICVTRVGVNQNCSVADLLCLDGLTCVNFNSGADIRSNYTCVAPQTVGQPCEPADINPLVKLKCNSSLLCSRGVCINPYSLAEGAFCANHKDCDTGYCDQILKQCTRKKMCKTSGAVSIAGESFSCTCVCSSGTDNLGRCIMDLCGRQEERLIKCLNGLGMSATTTSVTAKFAWLDSQSSFYKKCENEHQEYVNCQGYMSKLSAPAVALGDAINYNLASINGAATLSNSFMVVVAVVVSVLFML